MIVITKFYSGVRVETQSLTLSFIVGWCKWCFFMQEGFLTQI